MQEPSELTDLYAWRSAWAPRRSAVTRLLDASKIHAGSLSAKPAIKFRDSVLDWIDANRSLNWSGCDLKRQWAYCNGIHDALIQQVNHRHGEGVTFVHFEDDYRYYANILRNYKHVTLRWDQLDQLPRNAYVVVSWPNHSGMVDDRLARLITRCRALEGRIFLDCAFWGTVAQGTCDTGTDVFDAVAFSVSKCFHVPGLRAGIVFGDDLAPTLTVPMQGDYNLYNISSAKVATKLLQRFPADWLPDTCVKLQHKWCKRHGWEPADICLFAINTDVDLAQWRRAGGSYVRACLSSWYENKLA